MKNKRHSEEQLVLRRGSSWIAWCGSSCLQSQLSASRKIAVGSRLARATFEFQATLGFSVRACLKKANRLQSKDQVMNMRLWGLVIELCEDVCALGRARIGGYSFRFLHCFLSPFSRRPSLHMILQLKLKCFPHCDGLKTSTTVSPDKLPCHCSCQTFVTVAGQ